MKKKVIKEGIKPFHIFMGIASALIVLLLAGTLIFLGFLNTNQPAENIRKEELKTNESVTQAAPEEKTTETTSRITDEETDTQIEEEIVSADMPEDDTETLLEEEDTEIFLEEDESSPPPEPPVEAAEELVAAENTRSLCINNLDDDGDGFADARDVQCVGISCGSGVWKWSYLRTGSGSYIEDDSQPPERVGCVPRSQCVNIQGNAVERNVFYTNRWICGESTDFYRCTSSDAGSEQGDFECRNVDEIYKWVDTRDAEFGVIGIIADFENTYEKCTDNIDNDNDGQIDELDSNCRGVQCDVDMVRNYLYWVWSYLEGQDTTRLPPADSSGRRRIRCTFQNWCVRIDSQGVEFDEVSDVDNPKWVCGNNNVWKECNSSPSRHGAASDGGGWICNGLNNQFRWLRT